MSGRQVDINGETVTFGHRQSALSVSHVAVQGDVHLGSVCYGAPRTESIPAHLLWTQVN